MDVRPPGCHRREHLRLYSTGHGRPAAVPAGLHQQIERQARGEDSFELIEGNWSELQGLAYAVREAVFIKEQRH